MIRILILLGIISSGIVFRKALAPLYIGIVIAYLMNPLSSLIKKHLKCPNLLAIVISYILVLLILSALIMSFAGIITGKLEGMAMKKALLILQDYYLNYKDLIVKITKFDLADFDPASAISSLGKGLINLFIGLIASIYLLKDKDYFISLLKRFFFLFLDGKSHNQFLIIGKEIGKVLNAFVKGVFIDSIIVAVLSSLALTLLGVDMAVLAGIFAGLANIIPYFGPIIGMVPAVIFTINQGLGKVFLTLIALALIQQIECNLIYPKIVGDSIGLHPLFILVCVSAAGYLGGFIWMILAVPIAGIIRTLFYHWALRQ